MLAEHISYFMTTLLILLKQEAKERLASGINGTSIIIFINEWAGHRKSRGMGERGQ